jgi:hypothetical protein
VIGLVTIILKPVPHERQLAINVTINQETITRARSRVESAILDLNHIEDGFTEEHDRAARALVAALADLQQLADEFSPPIMLPTATA